MANSTSADIGIADICNNAYHCISPDVKVTVPQPQTIVINIRHLVEATQSATILGVKYDLLSFHRDFSANGQLRNPQNPDAVVSKDGVWYICGGGANSKIVPSGVVSEDCTQVMIIPMFLNLTDKIFVYKKITETVKFRVNAHPTSASFKIRWGIDHYLKFVIYKEGDKEALQGVEEFHVVQDGVDTLIHKSEWDKNPFPETGPEGSWGFYGQLDVKQNSPIRNPNVRQILLFDNPPREAIPLDMCGSACDPSVNDYGFYDYNENGLAGEFLGNALGEKDGGKDFYYPAWLRAMTPNALMKEWAEVRWNYTWFHAPYPSSPEWVPPDPETYSLPFGSFVKDNNGNYIHSALFVDRNDQSVIYNKCFPADILDKVMALGQPLHDSNVYAYPITLISSAGFVPPDEIPAVASAGEPLTDDADIAMQDDAGSPLYV